MCAPPRFGCGAASPQAIGGSVAHLEPPTSAARVRQRRCTTASRVARALVTAVDPERPRTTITPPDPRSAKRQAVLTGTVANRAQRMVPPRLPGRTADSLPALALLTAPTDLVASARKARCSFAFMGT